MLFDLFDNLHALQNVQTNKIETIFDCHLFVKLFIIFVDICIGSSEYHDDIFPCTWVSVNMSGTVMIKEGAIYMNEYKLYELHELRKDQSDSTSDTFHMEPGRTLFITMRACNDAELCNNKSLGSVTMMDGKAVMETSVGGEAIEMEYDMSGRRKKRSTGDSLVIITPNGMLSNLVYSMGVRVLFQRCLNLVSTQKQNHNFYFKKC